MANKKSRKGLQLLAGLLGALLIASLGWTTLEWRGISAFFTRLSYDWSFLFRQTNATDSDIRILYMDDDAARELGQRSGIWDRRVHASLIRRLKEAGAKAVFLDLVFAEPSLDPSEDLELAAAMREHGNVFIGSALELGFETASIAERMIAPLPEFRRAAKSWGLLTFRPVDPDWGVRQLYAGIEARPTATWVMAEKLGVALPSDWENRSKTRWLNYSRSFTGVGYGKALTEGGVPADFFRNKIVFVGSRNSLGALGLGKDEFRVPHTRVDGKYLSGVEIHATHFSNLFRKEWLTRLSISEENLLVILTGIVLGFVLPWFRPGMAALFGLGFGAAVCCIATLCALYQFVWFNWAVISLVQVPVAVVWAVGARYFVEERRKIMLRKAFTHYLSPTMANRIEEEMVSLAPGGFLTEGTVMFTDLEGFTNFSEEMNDPTKLSQLLVDYFTQTTTHILKQDGTILKFIGDAVMALWGAPVAQPDHATRGALAALGLQESAARVRFEGRILRTRVGLHSGEVLVGNLGSAMRFDYTAIGDTTNFASRLEGLNKYLGTTILISDTVLRELKLPLWTRPLGLFRVVGKQTSTQIHELLGEQSPTPVPTWIITFADALAHFQAADLEQAANLFDEARQQREDGDGPSDFYLKMIESLKTSGLPVGWKGEVILDSK